MRRGLAWVASLFLGWCVVLPVSAAAGEEDWKAPPEEAARRNPRRPTAESLARGEKLFAGDCVPCHGESGRGDGELADALPEPPRDLTAPGILDGQTDGEIHWKIRVGYPPMPQYATDFSDEELWDLVNHVRALAAARRDAGEAGNAPKP